MNWISVEDHKPELYQRVLVFDPTIPKFTTMEGIIRTHTHIVIGYYQGEDHFISPWFVPNGGSPTHWMPLPEDPVTNPAP